ncbi:Vitamin K-dependent protein C [Halotydeus destructor]|nr:Vitamin K-dependent protein C [Halotydeus destructor]
MQYWQCVNTGGTPYSYCGTNEICCVFGDESLSPLANFTSSPAKSSNCGKKGFDTNKVGVAEPGEWAWHVAILEKPQDLYVCGASLIDEFWVLTAAHCVDDYKTTENLKVRVGEHDVSSLSEPIRHDEYDVAGIFVNPKFNNNTLANDLALVQLASPVKKKKNINIVCLPDSDMFTEESLKTGNCVVTGWGRSTEDTDHSLILKEIQVPIWEHGGCESALKKHFGQNYKLPKTTLCAGKEGSDACDGDGGGPLVCEKDKTWYQVGIVSFGIGCGRPKTPGVYTKISSFTDWILNTAVVK